MIILGIDGGGTKTHALAVDEHGSIVGSATGGPSNYHTSGMPQILDVLRNVSTQALNGCNADIAVFCLGGCDSKIDEGRLRDGIGKFTNLKYFACYNDAFAPLRSGSSRPYGVAVVCGTGFNACGIGPDGSQAKLYSLGTLTGDWGGGYSLGEAIFAGVYRAAEGRGEPTILTQILLDTLKYPDLEVLAQAIVDGDIHHRLVAKLAPLVFDAAEVGDKLAQSILVRQGTEISTAALAMLRRLKMTDIEVDIVLSGGIVNGHGTLLMDTVHEQIIAECPRTNVHRLTTPPVLGAVYLGFDALHLPIPELNQVSLNL